MENFKLVRIDEEYCDYLRKYDNNFKLLESKCDEYNKQMISN